MYYVLHYSPWSYFSLVTSCIFIQRVHRTTQQFQTEDQDHSTQRRNYISTFDPEDLPRRMTRAGEEETSTAGPATRQLGHLVLG
jgi:hypothetical protein